MSPRRHLVVFARTPRLGQVKRRLAADIGAVAATAFHRQTTRALLARLGDDRRWRCWLAVTPDRDAARPGPWPRLSRHRRRIAQGPGSLGERMERVMRRLPPGPVVLIGSDIPAIRAHHVAQAFRLLGRCDAVFGPATDGGYWLVGLRQRPRMPDIFRHVRWSSRHALDDTVANLRPGMRIGFLETLEDIDDGAAWRRWRKSKSRVNGIVHDDEFASHSTSRSSSEE